MTCRSFHGSWIKNVRKELQDDCFEAGLGYSKEKDGAACTILLEKSTTPPRKGIVVWEGMKKQLVSQTHALHFVDINGDGIKDLVTGRRWWVHGPKTDPGVDQPAVLYWFEAKKGKDGLITFTPRLIDDDSGVGAQFSVADLDGDGLLDIIVSNRKGVHAFLQVREK